MLSANVEVLIADHIDENHRLQTGQRPAPVTAIHIMPASVNAIIVGPLDNSFLPVEKNELESVFKLQRCTCPGKFQKPRCAGASITRTHEREIVEYLCVVVTSNCDN